MSRGSLAELLLAATVVLWRLVAVPSKQYWHDWLLAIGCFWIYSCFRDSSSDWLVVLLTLMTYLLGIYLLGQIPHALTVLPLGS
jgi:hypothetical protein